ncbi:MAG: ABC transporter ATP-binding protein [Candidatus Brocadiaceae bacterium]|mgnify:CR=1 FL=1|nr:ABC transporter ATP-binding protein [Candidatus Brocadiaceae bacterium]
MILRAESITFAYDRSAPTLRGVTVELRPGVVTGLFGPNGGGKSTLLRCMNGALRPQSGRVCLDGRPIRDMPPREVARHVAVVPQDSSSAVPFTAGEVVLLGRYAHGGLWGGESDEDRRIAAAALAEVGASHLADRRFDQLSGGERRRVVIARALAQQGRVFLLDEPATHLDVAHQLELYRLTRTWARRGQAILIIAHDILVAPMFVDHAVLLNEGTVVAEGRPGDVLTADAIAAVFGCRMDVSWHDRSGVRAEFH